MRCLYSFISLLHLYGAWGGHPYKRCAALVEIYPWYAVDVLVWNILLPASNGSFIRFYIADVNTGLEFGTMCESTLPTSTDSTYSLGWQLCEDEQVSFRYQRDSIQIRRSYVDDWYVSTTYCYSLVLIIRSLGDYPYNSGAFYGSANTHFRKTRSIDGEIWTQETLQIPIHYQVS